MLGNQQCKVRVISLMLGILVAVAVDGDNAVSVLIYHDTVRIHTEGTDIIFEFLRAVDDLALIQFIRQM